MARLFVEPPMAASMKSKLDAAGIQFAFDPKEVGARFYRRSDA
jgi:hypothetical protein